MPDELEDTFEPLPEPEADAVEEQPIAEEPAVEPEPEPVEAQEEAPKEAEPDDPKTVPLGTFLQQRDELKELKAKIEKLSQQREAPKPVEVPKRPDPFEDPEGAAAWDMNLVHQRELNRSERMAKREYGEDFVNEAFEAAKTAGLATQFAKSQFGWEDMAEWHKKNVEAEEAKAKLSEVGDLDALKAKLREELLKEMKAEMVAQQVKNTPSLANETSVGGRTAPAAPTFTDLDDILK